VVAGLNTYTQGTFLFDGTLSGPGTILGLTADSGRVGLGTSTPGALTVNGDATLSTGSTFVVRPSDQLVVSSGTINVSGCTLSLDFPSGFAPAAGSSFTIIKNQTNKPVLGTFNDLPEGSIIPADRFTDPGVDDRRYYISYTGGNGGDVVITHLSTNQRFIHSLYQRSLARAASLAEMDAWVNVLVASGRDVVVNAIERSRESFTHLVKSWYATYLGRNVYGFEEQSWVNQLVSGRTEEQLLPAFLGSDEYKMRSPGIIGLPAGTPASDETFVKALYVQVLHRSVANISDPEWQGWVAQIPSLGRGGVSNAFLNSFENRFNTVKSYYTTILGRPNPPDDSTGEVAGWAHSNLDLTSIRAGFEQSQEFFLNG
jgi:hypothetical protein